MAMISPEELPDDERPSVRDRVIWAGTGWCAHTHQHDNTQAALAAAREALRIAREQMTTYDFNDDGILADLIAELAEDGTT